MESIHNQPDHAHRTTDFFDGSSEDDMPHAIEHDVDGPELDLFHGTDFAPQRHEPAVALQPLGLQHESKKAPLQPNISAYERLAPHIAMGNINRLSGDSSMSFNGSVDELLPGVTYGSSPQLPPAARIANERSPRTSAQMEHSDGLRSPLHQTKVDQLIGAHAIAHEITLQALMRDEDALERSLQGLAPMHPGDRGSLLPPALVIQDPQTRSLRDRPRTTPLSVNGKRVHVMPPPIDTSVPPRTLPPDLVRTPYPFSPPKEVHCKDLGQNLPSLSASFGQPNTESVIALGIRPSNAHSKTRITKLVIPATKDYSAVRSSGEGVKENHFRALDFDDAELFRQLRKQYSKLSGTTRFFSARTLARIAVSGQASRAADSEYGWLHQPRNPDALAYKSQSDTFSEEKIFQLYRNPGLGKSRYAFVQWAHRLAAATQVHTPRPGETFQNNVDRDLEFRLDKPEGLEFVISWSLVRIMLALLVVVALSVAAAVLWTLLALNSVYGDPHGGFRDAGDRVVPGVLLGICTLLVGLTVVGGWLGVSWLAT